MRWFRKMGEKLFGAGLTRRNIVGSRMVGGSNYRDSWLHTIYVAPTGNDTSGTGTKTNPYLTIKKALTVAVAGDGILLADGVYAEAEGAGASGYLKIAKNLSDWLTIEPENAPAGDVTITGTVGTAINIYFIAAVTNSHIKFRYLKFGMVAGSTTLVRMQSTMNNVVFENCTFTPVSGALRGLYITPAAITGNVQFNNCTVNKFNDAIEYYGSEIIIPAGGITGLSFNNSTIFGSDKLSGTPGRGIYVSSGANITSDITISACTISAAQPVSVVSGGVVTIDNCVLNAAFEVILGVDGTPASAGGLQNTKAVIVNSTINKNIANTGHALLLGTGLVDSIADNVTVSASKDYAIVVKENTGVIVRNCHLAGGTSAALYFKGAITPNAYDNVLTVTQAYGFVLDDGDSGHKCNTWQLQNTTINVSGTGKALNIGGDAVDDGGGICDYNTYQNNSGLGAVRGDANVANLTELQAAWADYDVTTNDAHSTVV